MKASIGHKAVAYVTFCYFGEQEMVVPRPYFASRSASQKKTDVTFHLGA